jgi:AcrR family transcriptional regulator
MTATDQPESATVAARHGLRERKKQRTREAIRREALRLFDAQGYDETTIEQIAEAADVSPSTFFRYYPTKEDVVLSDDYDPMLAAALLARPQDEPLATSLRRAMTETMGTLFAESESQSMLWTRSKLVLDVPSLRARIHDGMESMRRELAGAFSRRTGRPADDLDVDILAGAVAGALSTVAMRWLRDGRQADLIDLVDRAVEMLEPALRL